MPGLARQRTFGRLPAHAQSVRGRAPRPEGEPEQRLAHRGRHAEEREASRPGGTELAEIREPALAVARRLTRPEARVRLLRIVGLLLDAGAVAKRSLLDRVAAPVSTARPVARS